MKFILLFLYSTYCFSSETYTFLSSDYNVIEPYVSKNGGIIPDILNEIFKDKHSLKHKKYPTARVKEYFKRKDDLNFVSFGAKIWYSNRDYSHIAFTDKAIFQYYDVLVRLKGVKTDLNTGRIGKMRSWYHKTLLDNGVPKESIIGISNVDQGIKMLKAKRIDGLIHNSVMMDYMLRNSEEFDIIKFPKAKNQKVYLIYNKKNKALGRILNTGLDRLIKENKLEQILSNYR